MTSSLVGSEMCIRDSTYANTMHSTQPLGNNQYKKPTQHVRNGGRGKYRICLLYTSDAADDM
eukprot:2707296-Prorocentrum_lima.AAC.1